MKGLLLKDILAVRTQMPFFLFFAVLWLFIGFQNQSMPYFPIVITMFIVIIPISMWGYDEKAKWDISALTMPVSRATVAMSKYVMTYLLAVIGFVLSTVSTFAMTGNLSQSLFVSGGCALGGVAAASLMLLLMCKFGSERGRIFFFAFALIPMGVSILVSRIGGYNVNKALNVPWLLPALAVIVALLILVPPLLAVRLYRKKDFS